MEGQLYCDTHLPATPTKTKMEDKARKPSVSQRFGQKLCFLYNQELTITSHPLSMITKSVLDAEP